MQTFLPYPNFTVSAMHLDYRRLGKQRVECGQLITALQEQKGGWVNHPATKMWNGHITALMLYRDVCIREWVRRGYTNNMHYLLFNDRHEPISFMYEIKMPPWLGEPKFHASHRSNLLRKDPEFYGKFGWTESTDMEYVWPKDPTRC
jgi:hypothetical protein